jgi:hypothetical protein
MILFDMARFWKCSFSLDLIFNLEADLTLIVPFFTGKSYLVISLNLDALGGSSFMAEWPDSPE